MATEIPNVLLIRADNVRWFDVGAYHRGVKKLWTVLPAAAIIQQPVAAFEKFPPRQAPAACNPQAMVAPPVLAAAPRHRNYWHELRRS
jgi:hypothetical protein